MVCQKSEDIFQEKTWYSKIRIKLAQNSTTRKETVFSLFANTAMVVQKLSRAKTELNLEYFCVSETFHVMCLTCGFFML